MQIVILTYELEFLVNEMMRAVCGDTLNNPKPHDIIYSIFKKFNIKIQDYLVAIEYWIRQMSEEEKEKYGIAS